MKVIISSVDSLSALFVRADRTARMTTLFDILKKERNGTLVWVEAANDIQTARSRLEQLSAAESSCEFVVLRQIDLRIIVTSRQKLQR